MNHHHEDFENLLDQALQSYTSAEPRPGFDKRILASTASGPRLQSLLLRHLGWLTTAISAIAILIIIVIGSRLTPMHPEIARSAIPHASPIPKPAQALPIPQRSRNHPRQPVHPRALPAPAPEHGLPQLTSEDILLVQFASHHPQEALSFSEQQKVPDQGIFSSSLRIDPLTSNPIVITPIALNPEEQARF